MQNRGFGKEPRKRSFGSLMFREELFQEILNYTAPNIHADTVEYKL